MKNASSLLKGSQKGQIIQQILPAVIIPIVLIIMVIVFSNFEATVDHSTISTRASTAINTTTANTYSGFDLGSILPIVLFGVAILAIIIGAFVFRGR